MVEGPEGEYLTERLAEECIRLLDSLPAHEPFLLYFSLYQVHTPLQARSERIEYFNDKALKTGITVGNSTTTDRPWTERIPVKGNFTERTRQGHPVYAAMVSHMDDAVRRLIHKLKQLGIYDNTIVVFT